MLHFLITVGQGVALGILLCFIVLKCVAMSRAAQEATNGAAPRRGSARKRIDFSETSAGSS